MLIDKIRNILRENSADFIDEEIQDLIDTAKQDLILSGVIESKVSEDDPLIVRAIITYCKANFGWDNPEADRFNDSYNMIKTHLTLSTEYIKEGVINES